MNQTPPQTACRHRILVVEPTKATAVDLVAALEHLGHKDCAVAASCEEALQKVLETAPEIVFMDIHLAHHDDGFDAAHRIALLHESALIFLSTHSDEEDLQHALEGSPFGYVAKPFEPPAIRQAMETALANRAAGSATVKELSELVVTDALTGAGNRRKLHRSLRHEWQRCAREDTPLAALMVNLDRFRDFNASHGHAAGDECLQAVAGAMQAHCIRARDTVARWNGAQFVALLPATHAQGARHVGNRIIEAMRDFAAGRTKAPDSLPVSASVGVAVTIPDDQTSPESLLEKAERALNAAREQGGDRVIGGSTAPMPSPERPSGFAALWKSLGGSKSASEARGRRVDD